jgi:plasmid maintenance system killer protein
MINNAINLNAPRVSPANGLEKLVGNREDQHSIRINGALNLDAPRQRIS